MKKQQITNTLISFFVEAEKLKTTMRHSWTSNSNRQESSAEHSWMLCLIAISLFDQLKIKIDQLKVLKMLIIHDLAETIIGDIPAFATKERINKKELEKKALEQLVINLPLNTKQEIVALFTEYEKKQTIEAKVTQAIDKFESTLQHNISDIKTWDQNDYDIHGLYKIDYFTFDSFLKSLREELENISRRKISKAKQLHRVRPEIQEYYNTLNEKERKNE
ncbi:MAG TPA: HD domain-containing protein [Candidatus Sulfotelmatobacter sp.]|jgi:putative hydrolase of HD superfamily|nr:HD domain-containing protein [Candidatus Sulfotelmatobacter sp.]